MLHNIVRLKDQKTKILLLSHCQADFCPSIRPNTGLRLNQSVVEDNRSRECKTERRTDKDYIRSPKK